MLLHETDASVRARRHMILLVRDVDVLRHLTQATEQIGVAAGPKVNVPRHAVDPHVPGAAVTTPSLLPRVKGQRSHDAVG